jgi:hypothetical protein
MFILSKGREKSKTQAIINIYCSGEFQEKNNQKTLAKIFLDR